LGEIINHIKARTSIPVAVLTNGALLSQHPVREAIMGADVIVPSLDGGDQRMFQKINRPSPEILFEEMVEGLIRTREEFQGAMWLEVFLLGGINANEEEVEKIASWANRISPERIQLNSIDRPPAERFARRCSQEELVRLSRLFRHKVEIIGGFKSPDREREGERGSGEITDEIKAVIRRRPCRLDDLSLGLGLSGSEIYNYLLRLIEKGMIKAYRQGGETFYELVNYKS
jgi:wyosine [tRNA(Phe)-imidazoG37] synthetase (radical SAM superfamily)